MLKLQSIKHNNKKIAQTCLALGYSSTHRVLPATSIMLRSMSLMAKNQNTSNFTQEQKQRILEDSKRALDREKKRFERETGKPYDTTAAAGENNSNENNNKRKFSKGTLLAIALLFLSIACISYLADLRQDSNELAQTEEQQKQQRKRMMSQQEREQKYSNDVAQSLQHKLLSTVDKISERREMEKQQEKPPVQTLDEYRNSFAGRMFEHVESFKEKITGLSIGDKKKEE